MTQAQSKKKVVVVGNGMVGFKFCSYLKTYDTSGAFDVVVVGEEGRPAYDRVQLTQYFEHQDADRLLLERADWYANNDIDLRLGRRGASIDRERKTLALDDGTVLPYDALVIATGSAAFVPPIPGTERRGVFVYRTIEDLESIIEYAGHDHVRRAAVIGGGLLGLEAARAVQQKGLATHVIEMAPRLMPRQLDEAGGDLLAESIRSMGVDLHLGKVTREFVGNGKVEGIAFADGAHLDIDMIVISAGIKPRDELARDAGLETGERGGIRVDDALRTSDPAIFAIGEVALHDNMIYGLVAPGYEMANVVAQRLVGREAHFNGGDLSAKLKLMGTDVASFGDPFAQGGHVRQVAFENRLKGVYKKIVVDTHANKVLGGILVGDATQYAKLHHLTRSGTVLSDEADALILGRRGEDEDEDLPDSAQVCSCNNVTKGAVCAAVRVQKLCSVSEVKANTNAGTGCGGCLPVVTRLVNQALAAEGVTVKKDLCEHFAFSRQELYEIVRSTGIRTFEALVAKHGRGLGCEICKPTAASIFASAYNDMILRDHAALQDTNDRFLANIQRKGLYSIIPRIPGGEITPGKLIVIGEVAKKYGLATKITGGQRIDLLGARLDQLPDIWEDLVKEGFESGHAYAKGLRTVKSCVGSTWCRYGVQDSVAFAIRVENRYKGLRAPHKLKSAVSGCIRECAEAQSKDFGLIATEKGWNLYVCGNGGSKPRHADLLAADLNEETALRYIDRFLMFYIRTADKLTRTSTWVDGLEGGIAHVRDVVVNDSLGIGKDLESSMQALVDRYECEWAAVVNDPAQRQRFKQFVTDDRESGVEFVIERGQKRPRDWEKDAPVALASRRHLPVVDTQWVKVARVEDVPADSGIAVRYGRTQLALFHIAATEQWYATQNMCPHRRDLVLARGLIGDEEGVPKVACPQHKKTFSLEDGRCLTGDAMQIATFPVRVEHDLVYVNVPDADLLDRQLCAGATCSPVAAE